MFTVPNASGTGTTLYFCNCGRGSCNVVRDNKAEVAKIEKEHKAAMDAKFYVEVSAHDLPTTVIMHNLTHDAACDVANRINAGPLGYTRATVQEQPAVFDLRTCAKCDSKFASMTDLMNHWDAVHHA